MPNALLGVLDDLNARPVSPLPMRQFRPKLVVASAESFVSQALETYNEHLRSSLSND